MSKGTVHELKTVQPYFSLVRAGVKNFELRQDDRSFREGDILHLREFIPPFEEEPGGLYTGKSLYRKVGYILRGPAFGLKAGFVIMALQEV